MLETLITNLQGALADEIAAAQDNPRQGYRIYDGVYLGQSGGGHDYRFRTYFELSVPDDSPAAQIGDNLFRLLGWTDGGQGFRPFIRVSGDRAPNHLAELLGLNNIIPPIKRLYTKSALERAAIA